MERKNKVENGTDRVKKKAAKKATKKAMKKAAKKTTGTAPTEYKSGRASRERFLNSTAELLQERGYYGTGLNEILARSGAPRGSLYHHFPGGKDELTISALQVAGTSLGEQLTALLSGGPDLATGIRRIFDFFRTELKKSDYRKGCPIAAVAQEVAGEHPDILAACDAIYAGWEAGLAMAISNNPESGAPPDASDPGCLEAAKLVLSTLEGALLLSKTRRDLTYLDLAEAQVIATATRNS